MKFYILISVFGYFFCYYCSLGSVSSHVAALLYKLQASVRIQLNKIKCTSKSRQRAEPVPLGETSFKRPKKDEVVPNVNPTGYKVENLTGFSSLDPTKTSNEFLKQKFFELRSFAPDAALFTSAVQPGSNEITDVSSGNETDTAKEKDVDVNPFP